MKSAFQHYLNASFNENKEGYDYCQREKGSDYAWIYD
jgi:hypothetical protein